MFEKFPQLWRLERMLSKAQTEESSPQGVHDHEFISPRLKKSRDFFRKKIKQQAFDDVAEAFEKQAKAQNRALNLYDSDDLTGFKKPATQPNTKGKTKEHSKSKTRKPQISSACTRGTSTPNHLHKVASKEPQKECTTKFCNLGTEEKKALVRAMENFKPSDFTNVLSDEENDEQVAESRRHCRYPLPTMPLSIMMPYTSMPIDILPIDLAAVSSKVSEYDCAIENLMKIRNRLSSCFELFDDLCTSFRGPQNLDCFLRSMMSSNLSQSEKRKENSQTGIVIRSSSVIKQAKKELFASVPSEKPPKNEDWNFSGSRLLRPTISTRMKYVVTKNKEVTSDDVHLPAKSLGNKEQAETKLTRMGSCARNPRRSRPFRVVVPPSEEDAREDMLLRVRRHLMRMPWIGRSKRNSLNKVAST